MSDHLLRLARIVEHLCGNGNASGRTHAEAKNLIRDLEAAPATERRTITREEFNDTLLSMHDYVCSSDADKLRRIAAAWRLTVED